MSTNPDAAPSTTAAPLLPVRKKRSRKSLVFGLAAATLGLVGWQVWERLPHDAKAPAFVTAPAARADIARKVTATGTLSPLVQVEVGSQISGRILALHADYNSPVKAGDIIAEIDPQPFKSSLASAKARLAAAYADHKKSKAVAVNASAQYGRIKSLADSGAMSRSEADASLATKRSADASVSASLAAITVAKAAVEQAELDLTYATIRSPIDGVVVSRSVDVGQTVAASLSAPVLFVIAEDLRKMEVHTSVAESDVGGLLPGMAVEFTVDAFPADTFKGEVKQVRYEATTVSNVVTYDAVVAVENKELKLRPGMTANASFVLEARTNVLAVANKALSYRPPQTAADVAAQAERRANRGAGGGGGGGGQARGGRGKTRRLAVLRDGVPVTIRVEVGMTDGTSTEITGGELKEGDLVITGDDTGGAAAPAAQPGQRGSRRRGPPSPFS